MTKAIEALAAEIDVARAVIASLTPHEWAQESDCAGWSVQDVVTHMASVFHSIADPATIESGSSQNIEENAEVPVAARREWSITQVVAEYDEWAPKGLAALAALQEPPIAEVLAPLGNLGSHPLRMLASTVVFDHYCHLRWDLLAPHGPVVRDPLPSDDLRLHPTLAWMMAGLPQMCAAALAPVLTTPVGFRFRGPGASSWLLTPGQTLAAVSRTDDLTPASATVTASAHEFVCWGTKRRDWRAMNVTIRGDTAVATGVLDAINVI